jgi:hypothetical protein
MKLILLVVGTIPLSKYDLPNKALRNELLPLLNSPVTVI